MPFLKRDNAIFSLFLGTEGVELDEANPENRFTVEWIASVNSLLDQVVAEAGDGPAGLVITATGKFFSNGLDVAHLAGSMGDSESLSDYLHSVHLLYAKILAFPMPTAMAVNGHAFGAGAMLTLTADFSVMRRDRGFWSLPEVSLQIPFTTAMSSLLRTKLIPDVCVESMTTARRYGAEVAVSKRIVNEYATQEELYAIAVAYVTEVSGFAGKNFGTVKKSLYCHTLEDLMRRESISLT